MKRIILVFILILIIALLLNCEGPKDSNPTIDLKAEVNFTGTQLIILNKDDFDWPNVTLELNKKYALNVDIIKANKKYNIPIGQFTTKDGTRFNPFTTKPTSINIWSRMPENKRGFYYGQWN